MRKTEVALDRVVYIEGAGRGYGEHGRGYGEQGKGFGCSWNGENNSL